MYTPKKFRTEEFVPPRVYRERGEKSLELLDARMLLTCDLLRIRYGRIKINDWVWGGNYEWSGLRTPDSTWYRVYSQHSYGRAGDLKFETDVTAEEVRQDILANPDLDCFKYIGSIELGTSWLHFDTRNCPRIKTYPQPLK